MFSILGFMATEQGVHISKVAESGKDPPPPPHQAPARLLEPQLYHGYEHTQIAIVRNGEKSNLICPISMGQEEAWLSNWEAQMCLQLRARAPSPHLSLSRGLGVCPACQSVAQGKGGLFWVRGDL